MSTQRQKPIAAEGLCLASLSIPTAESGFKMERPVFATLFAGGSTDLRGGARRIDSSRLASGVTATRSPVGGYFAASTRKATSVLLERKTNGHTGGKTI